MTGPPLTMCHFQILTQIITIYQNQVSYAFSSQNTGVLSCQYTGVLMKRALHPNRIPISFLHVNGSKRPVHVSCPNTVHL